MAMKTAGSIDTVGIFGPSQAMPNVNSSNSISDDKKQISILVERVFHVDHILHQLQNHVMSLTSEIQEQREQLDAFQVDREQYRTKQTRAVDKVGSAINPEVEPESLRRFENQMKEIQSRLDNLHTERDGSGIAGDAIIGENEERLDMGKMHRAIREQHEHFSSMYDKMQERLEKVEREFGEGKSVHKDAADITSIDNYVNNLEFHYELGESVWDVAVLIGSPAVSVGASVILSVLYLTNVVMQVTFLVICGFFFVSPDIDQQTVSGAAMFRMFNAHHDSWLTYGSSLAQRLCSPDLQPPDPIALVIGGYQNSALSDFETYLKKEASGALERFFNGEMMCILALTCWVASVMEEIISCFDLGLTLVSFTTSKETVIVVDGEKLSLQSMSLCRKLTSLLFLGVRFGIVCALTVFGCFWLGGTDGITDLLLNAVALGFIVSIDEMLYSALAPDETKAVITAFAPLKRHRWPVVGGFETKNVFACVLLPACVIVSYQTCTMPLVESMISVYHEMCKGDLNFTYAHDAMTRVLLSPIQKDTGAVYSSNLTEFSVKEKISGRGSGPNGTWTLSIDPSVYGYSVAGVRNIPFAELVADLNPGCRDLLRPGEDTEAAFQFRALLKQQLDVWVTSCSNISNYCERNDAFGIIARAVCAETCTCNTPFSFVGSHVPGYGCPMLCLSGQVYQGILRTAPCSDTSLWQLHSASYWKKWATYIEDMKTPAAIPGIGDAMISHGCNFYLHVQSSHLPPQQLLRAACKGQLPGRMRPIAVACPATCGCHDSKEVLKADGTCAYGTHHCLNSTQRISS